MKSKRRKKRKQVHQYHAIRHTAVTLNPTYIDMTPVRLEALLPALPEMSFLQAYCGWQKHSVSGNVFVFFRTRWATDRGGIHIHKYLETAPASYSSVVFGMTHAKESPDFEERLGYDVTWEQILDIEWHAFCELITQLITDSLNMLLEKSKVNDKVTYSGDVRWIPKPYRSAINWHDLD